MPTTRYEDDIYQWASETAQAISDRRFADVDLERVSDEILDVGKSEYHGLISHLDRIQMHLLRIRHQPERRTRSWDLSIAQSQAWVRRIVRKSPSLKRLIPELVEEAYETARLGAARETGLELEVFPEQCPFSAGEVAGKLE